MTVDPNDLTDEQIGDYHDREFARWLDDMTDDNRVKLRASYVQAARANPEALRQLREIVDQEDTP